MSTKSDRTYLIHIRDAIESIEQYLEGVGFDEFTSNRMMIDALIRELK